VLSAGTAGTGAVLQAELLRAAHTARLTGLHRAEAAALGVVRCLRTARDPYSPGRLTELVTALRELLLVAHLLKAGDPEPALIGAVRRNHRPDGSLRLYGVCREPVIGADDLGGVVTHLLDDDGRWYTLRDVQPGGPARARRAGTALVAIRSFLSDHFRVSRGGLIISGATVSPEGRLLAERGVRATFAVGRPWTEAAPATVFTRPLAESAAVRFPESLVADPERTGDPERNGDPEGAGDYEGTGYARPLIGCDVEIAAADGEDLLVRELPSGRGAFAGGPPLPGPPVPGPPVRLAPAHSHPALAHTANLRQLGARPGLRIRVLGRLDPDRVTTLRALAVGPVPGTEATLRLPVDWQGRADLGYDLLLSDHFPPDIPSPSPPTPAPSPSPSPSPSSCASGDTPLWRVRRLVELAVTGGRRIAAESTRGNDHDGHAAVLRRSGLVTGSDLITALGAVAGRRSLDVFGRHSEADPDQYATQWLATAVYLALCLARPMSDLHIRSAALSDIDAVLPSGARPPKARASATTATAWPAHHQGPRRADPRGTRRRLVGSVIAGFDGWRCHLYRLAVHPEHRRQGIGSALLTAAEERFVALGGRRGDAMVLERNETGQHAWRAAGYAPEEHWRRWVKHLTT
jgi:ribosomal protein S18 acetylase RimI-like enzyme